MGSRDTARKALKYPQKDQVDTIALSCENIDLREDFRYSPVDGPSRLRPDGAGGALTSSRPQRNNAG